MYEKQFQGCHGTTIRSQSIDTHLEDNSCISGFDTFFPWVEMTIIHILRSVKDECCFSSLAFLNSKLWATLDPCTSCSWHVQPKVLHFREFSIHYHVLCLDWNNRSLWCYCIDARDGVVSMHSFIVNLFFYSNPSTNSFRLPISSFNLILCFMLLCSCFLSTILVSLMKLLQFMIWTWAFFVVQYF
jgi:hypothetical protein